jgi:transcriptional regulator with XRE-family HTH domain
MDKNSIANRLKILRHKTGLSQSGFALKYNIPLRSYQAWELGNRSPTTHSVQQCLTAFLKENIIVTLEWIINGTGTPPFYNQGCSKNPTTQSSPDSLEEEISSLKKLYNQLEIFYISDDSMLPGYDTGNIVAGNKLYIDFPKLHLKDCIVKTSTGIFFRKILFSKCQTSLVTTNTNSKNFEIITDPKIEWIAPVFWHRKKID